MKAPMPLVSQSTSVLKTLPKAPEHLGAFLVFGFYGFGLCPQCHTALQMYPNMLQCPIPPSVTPTATAATLPQIPKKGQQIPWPPPTGAPSIPSLTTQRPQSHFLQPSIPPAGLFWPFCWRISGLLGIFCMGMRMGGRGVAWRLALAAWVGLTAWKPWLEDATAGDQCPTKNPLQPE